MLDLLPVGSTDEYIVWLSAMLAYVAFKRYDPETVPPLVLLLLVLPGTAAALTSWHYASYLSLVVGVVSKLATYYTIILSCTALYRVSPLHPLAKYPGPLLNRLSKFWMVWIVAKGKRHLYTKRLHEKYGDIVRIGPNELSFNNVDAVQPMIGTPGLPKGPFWSNRTGGPIYPMIGLKDHAEHAKRRKPWTQGLNGAALKEYEEVIFQSCQNLVEALHVRRYQPVDICLYMHYFSFDFMGKISFGTSFNLVKEGKDTNGFWTVVEDGVQFAATAAEIPWAGLHLRRLPGPAEASRRLAAFARACAVKRISAGSPRRDLFSHLLHEDYEEAKRPPHIQAIADASLAIIAGSDTAATTMTALWYYLLLDPAIYKRLQAEVNAAFPDGTEPRNMSRLADMPLLNACINETLRLLPAVLSGVQRTVEPGTGGKVICDAFIPEGTHVTVHMYSLHRDPRYFYPMPNKFWPDRWLPAEAREPIEGVPLKSAEILHNTAAFIPFSLGPKGCAGKNLAMNEIRAVVSFVVQRFDMDVQKGFHLASWVDTVQDFFTQKQGPLPVILTARSHGG